MIDQDFDADRVNVLHLNWLTLFLLLIEDVLWPSVLFLLPSEDSAFLGIERNGIFRVS